MTKLEIVEPDLLKITHETCLSETNDRSEKNVRNHLDDYSKNNSELVEDSKLEIVEDLTIKETATESCKDKNLVTFSLPAFPSRSAGGATNRAKTGSNAEGECVSPSKATNKPTTPRKPAFNPLHVILKDKNKYYTTEYI